MKRKGLNNDTEELATSYYDRAKMLFDRQDYLEEKDYKEAEIYFTRALRSYSGIFAGKAPEIAFVLHDMAHMYYQEMSYKIEKNLLSDEEIKQTKEKVKKFLDRAQEVYQKFKGEGHKNLYIDIAINTFDIDNDELYPIFVLHNTHYEGLNKQEYIRILQFVTKVRPKSTLDIIRLYEELGAFYSREYEKLIKEDKRSEADFARFNSLKSYLSAYITLKFEILNYKSESRHNDNTDYYRKYLGNIIAKYKKLHKNDDVEINLRSLESDPINDLRVLSILKKAIEDIQSEGITIISFKTLLEYIEEKGIGPAISVVDDAEDVKLLKEAKSYHDRAKFELKYLDLSEAEKYFNKAIEVYNKIFPDPENKSGDGKAPEIAEVLYDMAEMYYKEALHTKGMLDEQTKRKSTKILR